MGDGGGSVRVWSWISRMPLNQWIFSNKILLDVIIIVNLFNWINIHLVYLSWSKWTQINWLRLRGERKFSSRKSRRYVHRITNTNEGKEEWESRLENLISLITIDWFDITVGEMRRWCTWVGCRWDIWYIWQGWTRRFDVLLRRFTLVLHIAYGVVQWTRVANFLLC